MTAFANQTSYSHLGAVDAGLGRLVVGFAPQGPVYFVDGMKGTATGDGQSWGTAVNTIDAAVTLGAAWQALQLNIYSRYTILVAGMNYPYAKVAANPSYCDIIGVGASPRGNGSGIARIRGITAVQLAALKAGTYGETSASAVSGDHAFTTTGSRGLFIANIQFECDGGYDCFHSTGVLLRSVFQDCAFMGSDASVTAANAGLYAASSFAGNVVRRCAFGTNGGPQLLYGIQTVAGSLNNNLIEDNVVAATTNGILLYAAGDDSNSVVRRNTVWGGTSTNGTVGILVGTHTLVVENMVKATTAITITTASNAINNHVVNGTTPAIQIASS